MIPIIPREYAQLASVTCFIAGFLTFYYDYPGGWSAFAFMAASLWIMLMSESLLLARVQNEMQTSLDRFNKKKEQEIEDLLYFLRDMRKTMVPFESLETTRTMINKVIHHPAIIVDSNPGKIIDVNQGFCDTFGWRKEEIIGKLNIHLHDPELYAQYAMGLAKSYEAGENWVWSRMKWVHKDGYVIKGSVGIVFIGTKENPVGALGLILPDKNGIIEEL